MPYIDTKTKDKVHQFGPRTPGELNFAITEVLIGYLKEKKESYQTYNDILGALEGSKQEIYERRIRDYEDFKMRTNGDVYDGKSSNTNLAWAGGFFEGEGCFYAHWYSPRIDGIKICRTHASLVQKDRSLLEQFKNVVKCGIINKYNLKDVYIWETSKVGNAKKVFDILRPWLGARRQKTFMSLYEKEQKQILHPLKQKCKNNHEYVEGSYKTHTKKNGKKIRMCLKCQDLYIKNKRKKR